jgi:conjugative relaxase-like TrwC/TraI family protein
VLSIARLRPATAARGYYERAARSDADWAAWTGIPETEWVGAARASLGLDGPVAHGALTRLLLGADPVSGRVLRRQATPRTLPGRDGHPATARPVAGFDLVFSAPKSVSLMLARNDAPADAIAAAQRIAWREALGLLESHACVVRRAGVGVTASGFVGAAFAHYANRDGDPHLHTHVVLGNQATAPDEPDRWRALDAIPLLVGWRRAAGAVYEAHLRWELSARLGVGWRQAPHGGFDIAGVTAAQIRAASGRSEAVQRHARAHGVRTAHGARVAGRVARPARRADTRAERAVAWSALADQLGLPRVDELSGHGDGHPTRWRPGAGDRQLVGADRLTATSQTFSHADVIAAVAWSAPAGATATQILTRAAATAALEEVTLVRPARAGRAARYTTDEVLSCETRVLDAAERWRRSAGSRATPEAVATALGFAVRALSAEQLAAAEHAAVADDRIAVIVGRAGSGKTTALAAAAQALWASGIPVTGSAPSAQAAHVLEQATGIPSATLHTLCGRWESGVAAPAGCIIVDEASMADSRTLARVVAHVGRSDARLVLVGDPRQLPDVGPGGLFAALADRLGAPELTANHRQRAEWERDALARLRAGETTRALAAWDAHGRITRCHDATATLASAWWNVFEGDPDAVMIAYRRADVAALNRDAAARLEAAGRRGPRLGRGDRQIAVGDTVRCRINDPRAGLRNGLRGRVSGVDPGTGSLELDTAEGMRITIPREYRQAGGVEHAWALTGHSAQGLTVEHAFVLGPPSGRHAEWGYVALSRARQRTQLFVEASGAGDPIAELAVSLGRPVARPPAIIELGDLAVPGPERGGPDGQEPPGPPRHKATLTRGPLLEH